MPCRMHGAFGRSIVVLTFLQIALLLLRYEYLADRGIDDGLAEGIVNYASSKEQVCRGDCYLHAKNVH